MTCPTRFREIVVSGTPRDLGRQIGDAAGAEIRGFCEVALQRVNKTIRISRATALSIATRCIAFADRFSPDMLEELRGTAEAARVSIEDLMFLQVRNQLHSEDQGACTSLSLRNVPGVTGGAVVAQNWDNDPALDAFTVVLTRRPYGKPAVMTVTQAGLIAYIGFNDRGIGACLNTLPAPSREVGVPHYFTLRGIYEADALDGAVAAVRRAERAIPANIMLSTPQGPANLEVTIDDVHVIRNGGDFGVTHTNHCLHADLLPINAQFPELIQSYPRKCRIDGLLGTLSGPPTVATIQAALRDHENHPRSICRHANDDPGTGFWQTVLSVIIEPAAGRMHVSRGTPCEHSYETYSLDRSSSPHAPREESRAHK